MRLWRSWLVIPAMGIAAGGAAVALGATPMLALVGAALATCVRALAGESAAALAGACVAPLVAVALLAGAHVDPRAAIAVAAAAWAIAELAQSTTSPLVAMLPAVVAAVLDPSCVALVAIAGARLVSAPWDRPRWVPLVPALGALAIAAAILAGTRWTGLGARWFGGAAHPIDPARAASLVGESLGPIVAVAALAGAALVAAGTIYRPRGAWWRVRHAELAVLTCAFGALCATLRAGAVAPSVFGLAALCAGIAIGRFAALVRFPAGQAILGVTAGALILAAPALLLHW